MSENPYSDTKTRTTFAWNAEQVVLQGVKNSQNLYNNSIKKKNYFYPHVGAGGGAGGMRAYKWRDTTPMKFTLTTMTQTANQNDTSLVNKFSIPFGGSFNKTKAKAIELKIIGGSMIK